jgi:argininosuccinate lyase
MNDKNKLWDGRFTEATDTFVEAFTASVDFDKQLAQYDIQGSIAHATMLAEVGVLSADELADIERGLAQIAAQITAGNFTWSVALEDVHMNIEKALTDIIGDTGKKLHTGRSRNDQIATDIRLYLRAMVDEILEKLRRLQSGLLDLAEQEVDTIMPGSTHLQVAQPVTPSHGLVYDGRTRL